MNHCPKCGISTEDYQAFCLSCGAYLKTAPTSPLRGESTSPSGEVLSILPSSQAPPPPIHLRPVPPTQPVTASNRFIVSIAAMCMGSIGIHSLLLKKWVQAFFFIGILLLSIITDRPYLLSFTAMISILQGIRMICLTDDEFLEIYGKKNVSLPQKPEDRSQTFQAPQQY